jgi:hypothetical protein
MLFYLFYIIYDARSHEHQIYFTSFNVEHWFNIKKIIY